MSRVFTNSQRDRGSIPGRVIPKTLKMVLDVALLSTQHNKVGIKGKMEQSREKSSTLSYVLYINMCLCLRECYIYIYICTRLYMCLYVFLEQLP